MAIGLSFSVSFNNGGIEVDAEKIAIISDIKANKYALEAFIKYMEKDKEIEYVLNLGNFIQNAPNP
jgi:predicted phosphodiesterase